MQNNDDKYEADNMDIDIKKPDLDHIIIKKEELNKIDLSLRPYLFFNYETDNEISIKEALVYAKTNKSLNNIFQPILNKKHAATLQKLLQAAVYGDLDTVKNIIQKYPKLLYDKGIVVDYSGRTIEGTAFQIALGAMDIEMCEAIKSSLDKINPEEAYNQYQEWIPSVEDEKYAEPSNANNNDYIKILNNLAKIIKKSRNDDECTGAIEAFRLYMQPQGIIRTGYHFNPDILIKAYKLHEKNFCDINSQEDIRKNSLFFRQVIGYIQRYLPANFAHDFCYGLHDVVDKGKKPKRTFKFRYYSHYVFYPLDSEPSFSLGIDYASAGGTVGRMAHIWGGATLAGRFSKLCQTKDGELSRITRSLYAQQEQHHRGCILS